MRSAYEWLLRLYPEEFRRQFGQEMQWVFSESLAACGRGVLPRFGFTAREIAGIVRGAGEEQLRACFGRGPLFRRVFMITSNRRFRFPLAGIAFMVLSLGVVLYAIRVARLLAFSFGGSQYVFRGQVYVYKPEHLSFLQTFGFAFAVTVVAAVVIWAVMHTMHRSGVHRLAEAQTWPGK